MELNMIRNLELRNKCKYMINAIQSKDTKTLEDDYDFYMQLKDREFFGSNYYNAYRYLAKEIEKEINKRKIVKKYFTFDKITCII